MTGKYRRVGEDQKQQHAPFPNYVPLVAISALTAVLMVAFGLLQYYLPLASRCRIYQPYNASQLSQPRQLADGRIAHRVVVVTDLVSLVMFILSIFI